MTKNSNIILICYGRNFFLFFALALHTPQALMEGGGRETQHHTEIKSHQSEDNTTQLKALQTQCQMKVEMDRLSWRWKNGGRQGIRWKRDHRQRWKWKTGRTERHSFTSKRWIGKTASDREKVDRRGIRLMDRHNAKRKREVGRGDIQTEHQMKKNE